MRHIIALLVLVVCVPASRLNADHVWSFPGPFNVGDSATNFALNDAINTEMVPEETFRSFRVTADWSTGGGSPWSNEAVINLTWGRPPMAVGTTGEFTAVSRSCGKYEFHVADVGWQFCRFWNGLRCGQRGGFVGQS